MRFSYTEVSDQGAAQKGDPEGVEVEGGVEEKRQGEVGRQRNRAGGADGVYAGRGAGAEAKGAGRGVESGVEGGGCDVALEREWGGGQCGARSGIVAEDMYKVRFEGSVGQGECANA